MGPNSNGLNRRHGVPMSSKGGINLPLPLLVVIVAVPSFFLGSLTSMYSTLDCHTQVDAAVSRSMKVQGEAFASKLTTVTSKYQAQIDAKTSDCLADTSSDLLSKEKTGLFASAIVRTPRAELTELIDFGVPLDESKTGYEDALIIYGRDISQPESLKNHPGTVSLDSKEAISNCEFMNVIFTSHDPGRRQCIALIPQYESFHIQRWMRLDGKGKLDSTKDLRMVSRGQTDKGHNAFSPPLKIDTTKAWIALKQYIESIDDVLAELKLLLEKIVIDNTVIVMVVNFGQSELLTNFVCTANSRNLDISNVIVFTTDQESTDLATSLGLTAYYDKRNFGDIPSEAARRYGDRRFTAMMMAKVMCVQLVSMLGYDFLFQDVDIIWYKNPLEFFKNTKDSFDVYFQDDGAHSTRYAPYSANSGFYFVRNNERTFHFLAALLQAGDLILKTDSHQQALVATMNEHVSLFGLRVKVLSRDMEEFPGGYQWNQKSGKYMRGLFAKEINPYIFHMSWTKNKDNKLLYFRQFGEWYVQEQCIQKRVEEIEGGASVSACCAAEPLVTCHYRDKPSVIPCKDSPPIDPGKASFWK